MASLLKQRLGALIAAKRLLVPRKPTAHSPAMPNQHRWHRVVEVSIISNHTVFPRSLEFIGSGVSIGVLIIIMVHCFRFSRTKQTLAPDSDPYHKANPYSP